MFRDAYLPIMQGASYGMMPSYYEPFGMANEYFLNGVSCIGRATGGIIQQIVPYHDSKTFNKAVASKANRWHKSGSKPSGFLFREDEEISNLIEDWEAINAADYSTNHSKENRLENRKRLPLVRAISTEMNMCIQDAALLYSDHQDMFLEFVINGAIFIDRYLSWDRSAQIYLENLIT
jgi:glycogen synthase